jgi:BirA family transcriptional regulator, biotin operon repressor / biotin---[acetyl-CoA-carboxylase] ligase
MLLGLLTDLLLAPSVPSRHAQHPTPDPCPEGRGIVEASGIRTVICVRDRKIERRYNAVMTPTPHRIIRLSETGSTNADAMRLALAGEALPLWVTAERQVSGRGRAGRTWVSTPGNLQASLAFTCNAPLQRAGELSLVAGIALIEAIRTISPLAERSRLRLKWPNDLLIGTAKAGGILVETTTARGEPSLQLGFLAVLGFGLNVATSPETAGRATASLAQSGMISSAETVLEALADQCDAWIKCWDNGNGFTEVRAAWMQRAGASGEAIHIQTASGPVSGTYQGLAPSGALLAEVNGRTETITYGDVELIAGPDKWTSTDKGNDR